MTLGLVALLAFGIAGSKAIDAFFYLATIGVLSLLVMYVVTNVAALRHLFVEGGRRREAPLAVIGILAAGYTLYKNIVPAPPSPFDVFPYVVAAWLLLGAGLSLVPGAGRLITTGLARERAEAAESAD